MRYLKLKVDVSDESYIYLHRKLKKFLDEEGHWYGIRSWRYVEDES